MMPRTQPLLPYRWIIAMGRQRVFRQRNVVPTVRGLAYTNSGAQDFVRPGHIFPLIGREGGVLMRSGHTEAAIDLCRLANLVEVGVVSELVNDDGSVMRGPEVTKFAKENCLKKISVGRFDCIPSAPGKSD